MSYLFSIFALILYAEGEVYFTNNFDGPLEKRWIYSNNLGSEFEKIIEWIEEIHQDDKAGTIGWIQNLILANSQSSEDVQVYEFRKKIDPVEVEENNMMIQFSLNYEKNLSCTGGYVKLFDCAQNFFYGMGNDDHQLKYLLSFGFEICESSTATLHLLLKQNFGTQIIRKQVRAEYNETKHVYAVVIKNDSYEITFDGKAQEVGKLEEHWFRGEYSSEGKDKRINKKICAVGVDVWQVKSGTIFDNILITDDIKYITNVTTSSKTPKKATEDNSDNIKQNIARQFQIISTRYSEAAHQNSRMNKIFQNAAEVLRDIRNGSTLLLGGFGLCGIPENLIKELLKLNVHNLTVISSHAGTDSFGLGVLLAQHKIRRIISSAIGRNKEFERQYLEGELEVELTPQGSLAERIRAGGAGIPAFFTRTGYDTYVREGKVPIKYKKNGEVEIFSEEKRTEIFNGKSYLMEKAINADFALIKAWKADTVGNLVFRESARNFNPTMATAAKITISEVEEVVNAGDINPDEIHTPGIYVDRIIKGKSYEKRIEKIVVLNGGVEENQSHERKINPQVEKIIRRAVLELRDGMYVNLGIGIPQLVSNYIPKNITLFLQSENGVLGLGPFPTLTDLDPDVINAGKEAVTIIPGASFFDSAESFAMIRGGHLDLAMLGALEVSKFGDLANWIIPGKLVKGMGGAMDLVSAPNTRTVILMEHNSEDGSPKIVKKCNFPLTGSKCVDLIITDKGVFSVDENTGLTLLEIADGETAESIKTHTGCDFAISRYLKPMKQIDFTSINN